MTHISIITPVYKAEGCLRELYKRLAATLETITSDFEIIMVEDCGKDRSWEIIVELAQQDIRVKGIQFSRNFGQHYGITAGLDYCDGDWVVVMDCDLQDRPEEIPRLYEKAQEGYEVVLAKRCQRKDSLYKRLTSRLYGWVFCYFTDIEHDWQVGNFRIISKKVVLNYRLMREKLRFFGGLISWMGYPTASIDVQHDARFHGEGSYTFRKLWKLATENIIAHSDKPLRLVVRMGFAMSFIAFCFGVYLVLRALLYGSAVLGWSSIIVSLYFIGGIIIAILGVMGVYLGKNFDECKKRPLYIIKNLTDERFSR